MRVLYDHQAFLYNDYGGVARYYAELVRQARDSEALKPKVVALFGENVHLREIAGQLQFSLFGGRFPGRLITYRKLNEMVSRAALRIGRYDVFHCTYYDSYYRRGDVQGPVITTVHDLSYEDWHDMPERKKIIGERKKNLRLSDRIICVSHATKARLLQLYPWLRESSTHVVHHGWRPWTTPSESMVKRTRSVLYVGNRRVAYKNFDTYVRAMGLLHSRARDVTFICAGGGAFSGREMCMIRRYGLEAVMKHREILSDEDLGRVYGESTVFVYPSKCEGFGMPVLEAFAARCPVVLARAGALPEVGGDAAVYFDANNPDELANKVIRLLNSKQEQKKLVSQGARRLSAFSWEKAFRETTEIYRDAFANYADNHFRKKSWIAYR